MLIVAGPVGQECHDGHGHPERPERIGAAMAGLADLDLDGGFEQVSVEEAPLDVLERVHDREYLDSLARLSEAGGGSLDLDTFVTSDSWTVARRSAGAGLSALQALRDGRGDAAFVVARPPGHHARPGTGMGFCLLNNIAVAAAALRAGGERVLIFDWDVHHGNGSQEIFWNDPEVMYVSMHQWPLYPGTGHPREIGGPGALGRTLNIPLPPGATGDTVQRAMDLIVAPAATEFSPSWVLVSAGFDGHRDDPLASLGLTSGDFAELARAVAELVPQPGRLALFLEGGYDLTALRASVASTIGALMHRGTPAEQPTAGGPGRDLVESLPGLYAETLDSAS